MEFFTWTMLGTYAGCLAATLVLTQLVKGLWPEKWPTQILSYIFALATLILANLFLGTLSADNVVISVFNAAIVALAANGGYDNLKQILEKK